MRHYILSFVAAIIFLAGTPGHASGLPEMDRTDTHPNASLKPASPGVTSSPDSNPVKLLSSQVQVRTDADGKTFIQVNSSHTLRYHSFRMDHPYRLVVDIENARLLSPPKSFTANSPFMSTAQVAENREDSGPVVRVVAQLQGCLLYTSDAADE